MKNIITIIGATTLLFASCNKLDQIPKSTVSKEAVFNSEAGLKLYTNSFYTLLPTSNDILKGDNMGDFVARKDVPDFFRAGAFGPAQSTGWTWTSLRNINYFLENNNSSSVSEAARNNYNGIARLFRALFYFEKVKRFGDVPWINRTLSTNDELLYSGRDPRALVMDSVLNDLNYAIENISAASEATRTRITRTVAQALKSRICLFEGTYRKYHTELNLQSTANRWLQEAADAAQAVINSNLYSLANITDIENGYRNLFISTSVNSETLLCIAYSQELGVFHDANWYYTSATAGDRLSFTRKFINTYLRSDGTPFTDLPDYKTQTFMSETKNRDKRLNQTIRTQGYTRINGTQTVNVPPQFSQTYTGYQPAKWVNPDMGLDGGSRNASNIPIIRYAEVLLNYAEAKAELGTLTDEDWANTIGQLRKRGGITGGLSTKPTQADNYIRQNYFPNISDPVILEVRRERGIELALEGFRFYDIIRWKRGELFTDTWNGMYVPALNTMMDLNEDGVNDVYFYTERPSNMQSGVIYINVAPEVNGQPNNMILSETNKGEIQWMNTIPRVWNDRMYLYPIPLNDLTLNPNLKQNPNW
ncbi:RagB/SusD family nutrient uptake outer membrane protein [Niabella digestorum]|uniref:RagB/SusD family nutrient uptake outer membrane protein n=1 Tax=Niabella digestorum TaxID=3117701 RepID=A0ABU7RK00_9BACT